MAKKTFQSKKIAKKLTQKKVTISKVKEVKGSLDFSSEEWLKKDGTSPNLPAESAAEAEKSRAELVSRSLDEGRAKGEEKRIKQEFKKYAPDLEPDSGKSAKHCAITAMTLAHHGTKEALESLKNFKKDKRAPGWIDCAVEECEMMLWDDTVGRQLNQTEKKLKKAAEEIFNQGLVWEKRMTTDALKVILKQQGTKFSYGETVKLYYENKAIAEDKAEFIIDDVLLVSIKPRFAEWLIRFKQGLEGKDLRQGDLENIEQGMIYDDDGKELEEPRTLAESFDDFYSRQFQCLLQMSKKEQGILLDFSGEKIYGKYFSPRQESGWQNGHCSGCCEACLQELKCSMAQEWRQEDDKKRYRILKQLIKEIVEIEEKMELTKRPSSDIEYKIKIAEKLRDEVQGIIKKEKNKEKAEKLQNDLSRWNCEIAALQGVLNFEQPRSEEKEQLKTLKQMYQTIKQELETKEYKNDVEGLEVYYGKAKPKSENEPNFYHDPLCECDEYEPLTMEESLYKHRDEEAGFDDLSSDIEDTSLEEVPF